MSTAPSIYTLAVVGTAGRNEDAPRITPALYARMADSLSSITGSIGTVRKLVSGGAAVADHLAVGFFLRGHVAELSLHVPASFCLSAQAYVEPYKKSPGSISNFWHRRFSQRCGGRSLQALARAMQLSGCTTRVHYGFEARNRAIAEEADGIVAMTFGAGPVVKRGGTWGTVEHALARGIPSWHVDLNSFQIYAPAELDVRQPVAA